MSKSRGTDGRDRRTDVIVKRIEASVRRQMILDESLGTVHFVGRGGGMAGLIVFNEDVPEREVTGPRHLRLVS